MESILSSADALRGEGWLVFSPEDVERFPLVDLSDTSITISDPAAIQLAMAGWLAVPPVEAGAFSSLLVDARCEEERTQSHLSWPRRHAYAVLCICATLIGWSFALPLVVTR